MHRKIVVIYLMLLLAMILSGCGFKPRGKVNQDLTNVVVNIDAQQPFHPLVLRLKRKLQSLGAQLDSNQSTAAVLVLISMPVENQKTLSVDETGRPLEYELHVEISAVVTLNLIQSASSSYSQPQLDKVTPSTIFARRVLVYDNNQLLAKSREREQVRNAIYDVLIEQLIERIRGALALKS